jgi:cell division protease FtsH
MGTLDPEEPSIFTVRGKAILGVAKAVARAAERPELDLASLATAVASNLECRVLLARCLGIAPSDLVPAGPAVREVASDLGPIRLAGQTREILSRAREFAMEVPDRQYPGLIDRKHILSAMAASHQACSAWNVQPVDRKIALSNLYNWYDQESSTIGIDDLVKRLRTLRSELLDRVFGQDHAVHAFVEGLFNAEILAPADTNRRTPRAVFVFAGPPGVGKTFLAECGAAHLQRSSKRFDMSSYSNNYQVDSLVGVSKSFQGAHPGLLTEFVESNPDAVLIFDEIEKCHSTAIHLFLQVLDGGVLEDRFHERNVEFRDTTIIFTTNAGRKLYDRPNRSGVNSLNASFHRRTILDALQTEVNPQTREPFFPPAICSRMATGYPLLFNYLKVNELERVAAAELHRCAALFEQQYYKQITFNDLIPMALVLREGAKADARTLRSQAETFVKTEIFKFCQLFRSGSIDDVLSRIEKIEFAPDEATPMSEEIRALFELGRKPRVLLVGAVNFAALYTEHVQEIEWRSTNSPAAALEVLANEDLDFVVLDLWLDRTSASTVTLDSALQFDHVPAASRGLEQGQELLRTIHERLPGLPVFLLSLVSTTDVDGGRTGTVDDELFVACVRGGGARGMIQTAFVAAEGGDWYSKRDIFASDLLDTGKKLHRERSAERMGDEHKVLTFQTAPKFDERRQQVSFRLRNLRFSRAVASADAGEILADVERPKVRFEDVIGATTAKSELQFFIDYLKDPRRFSAMGVKPPRGVLLYGPPGTGKTMLARALAGETNVAFVPAAASSFVTKWQGSGPESVRELFERARRYAPAILFIDEIDAIGRVRTGGPSGHGEEMALNALLTEMDGFVGPSPDRPVFVLAATNFNVDLEDGESQNQSMRMLDPALVRRFSRPILVDLPDTAARRKYLEIRLSEGRTSAVSDAAVALLSEKSTGMSIASLEQVIDSAAREALKLESAITDEIVIEAMDMAREGEAKVWSPQFLENTARHEAGHTILYWLSGWYPAEISIVARADHGGGMRRSEEEIRRESLSRAELLAQIRTALAGRAAEQIYNGPEGGLTTGAAGDLALAVRITRDLICRYGMFEEFGLGATPDLIQRPEAMASPLYVEVHALTQQILRREMNATIKLLENHKDALDRITNALLERNRLLRDEVVAILGPSP